MTRYPMSSVLTLLLFGNLLPAASQPEEEEIRQALFSRIIDLAETSLERWDQLKSRYKAGDDISHHYLAPARVLAWVYSTAHPENPFRGDMRARDVAIEMGNILAESFGQGDVRLSVHPGKRGELTVAYSYDVFSTKALFVQLPLIVFHDTWLTIDGSQFAGEQVRAVKDELLIANPTTKTEVRVVPPKGSESAARPFIEPLRSYGVLNEEQYHRPYYEICILSVKIESPQGRGGGEFRIEVADLN